MVAGNLPTSRSSRLDSDNEDRAKKLGSGAIFGVFLGANSMIVVIVMIVMPIVPMMMMVMVDDYDGVRECRYRR
jgi:hypothetical protein